MLREQKVKMAGHAFGATPGTYMNLRRQEKLKRVYRLIRAAPTLALPGTDAKDTR